MRLIRLGCAALVIGVVATGFDASAGIPDARRPELVTSKIYDFGAAPPVCKLGVYGPRDNAAPDNWKNVLSFDPVNGDYFYTWLNLDSLTCNSACGLGSYGEISAAHLVMSFPTSPETLVVAVGIVGVTPATCRYQNSTIVTCPAFDQMITWEGATNQPVDFTIPIPPECRLEITASGNGQAFLQYNFKYAKHSSQATRPRAELQTTAVQCHTFVPVSFDSEDWYDNYTGGNPIMYVDVEQCQQVPVRHATWGQLKQLYR